MRTTVRLRASARKPATGRALRSALVAVLLGTVLAALLTPATGAEESDDTGEMVLVLDASGSMKEPHGDGRTRFRAAVSAMQQVVGARPGGVEVGLRIYGSRIADGPGSCKDSELVVPVGPADKDALRTALGKARPLGNTPIAYSLEQAATDLSDSGPRTIVLVSDGEESC
jgi:Ca-activated chloride channel family protein